MYNKLLFVAIAALFQSNLILSQRQWISPTTTAAEMRNPYTWYWPYAIAASEAYRDYYVNAQQITNQLYQQSYATQAFPWAANQAGQAGQAGWQAGQNAQNWATGQGGQGGQGGNWNPPQNNPGGQGGNWNSPQNNPGGQGGQGGNWNPPQNNPNWNNGQGEQNGFLEG